MKPTMLDQSYYETANEIISRYPGGKILIPIIQTSRRPTGISRRIFWTMWPKRSALQRPRLTAWPASMRTSPLNRREMYSRSCTERLALISINPRRCCSTCVRNWDSVRPTQTTDKPDVHGEYILLDACRSGPGHDGQRAGPSQNDAGKGGGAAQGASGQGRGGAER